MVMSITTLFFLIWSTFSVEPISPPITEVLRLPVPAEKLSLSHEEGIIVVQGPTFTYRLDASTTLLAGVEVVREGNTVVSLTEPLGLWLDEARLFANQGSTCEIVTATDTHIVLRAQCQWAPDVVCTVLTTVYNDGVLVSAITLTSNKPLELRQGIRCDMNAKGIFTHYLHKRRDTHGLDCYQGALPPIGETVRLYTPTSCLQAFSNKAALAMFTDRGDFYRDPETLDAAAIRRNAREGDHCLLHMHQHIIHVGPEAPPYLINTGEPFAFRVGFAVAPNRLPHPRRRDLRMFVWIGDDSHPYPSDEEIRSVAQLGFTLFQMHRLGPPGIPRPPAEELDRLIRTVHDTGMLFVWTANADLQYRHDPKVTEMIETGTWKLWQGFNYGGRYTDSMDSYCDLMATCLASPNGLADYRMECKQRMFDRYSVDGMYIDDNLAYANCTLWKEHGHPQPVYDCLIELHEVNWRRRQVLHEKCPHAVLIDHCSRAFVLPVIAPFDGHLFGEGYTFSSIESYLETFGSFENMYAQGYIWAGGVEPERSNVQHAYMFDLLTGGGQYCYLDWRLWPEKFPYAAGVQKDEVDLVTEFNLAQYYFGMYESDFRGLLPTVEAGTYAALYHNRVWNEILTVYANTNDHPASCLLAHADSFTNNTIPDNDGIVFNINERRLLAKGTLFPPNEFPPVHLNPNQLCLLYKRSIPNHPCHVWGGKRLGEHWDDTTGTLSVLLSGPVGREEEVFIFPGHLHLNEATAEDRPAEIIEDVQQGLARITIRFTEKPVMVRVRGK